MVNCEFLYDKEYFADKFKVKHLVEKDLSYTVYENAYIVPDLRKDNCTGGMGVYTEQKEYVKNTTLHYGLDKSFQADEIVTDTFCDETVVYVGVQYPVWGHVLTDDIKYFWFLKTEEFRARFSSCRLVFIKMGGDFSQNAIRFFQLLGVELADLSEVKEITQYRRVVVPDPCFFYDENGTRFFTEEYRRLIQGVRDYQKERYGGERGYEKLYFTYSAYGKWKYDIGEGKIEDFFRHQGYQIIAPEKYTLEEQLKMLANCRYFASTDGSCAHNCLFLPEQANVVLIPRAFYITEYQLALNDAINLNVTYIDASLSVLASRNIPLLGPLFYYESEQLRKFFHVTEPCAAKYWRTQFKDFKLYCKALKFYDNIHERYMPEYYARQFMYCMEQYRNFFLGRQFFYPFLKLCYKLRVWGIRGVMQISVQPRIEALFKKIKRK